MAPIEVCQQLSSQSTDVRNLTLNIYSQIPNQRCVIFSPLTKAPDHLRRKLTRHARSSESHYAFLEMSPKLLIRLTITMGPEKNGPCGGCSRSLKGRVLRCKGTAGSSYTYPYTQDSTDPRFSVYLEPKVWLLFQELIRCFPVATLARLLRTHGFVKILSEAMKALGDVLEKQKQDSVPSANAASSELSDVRDSSSATVETTVKSPTTSRKRKHDGTLVHQHERIVPHDVNVQFIHDEITDILSELLALTTENAYGYACEHLKMAMRPCPDEAAQMLGISMTIANWFIHNPPEAGNQKYMGSPHPNVACWFDMWDSRSFREPNTNAEVRVG